MNKQSYIMAFLICILSIGGYMAMPLFPILTSIDKITFVQASSLTAVYIFTQMATPIVFGPMGDLLGYKRVASTGELIRGIGFIGIGTVNNYTFLILFAGLAGIGGGVTGPSLQALMMKSADSSLRPKLSSLKSSATSIGLLVGPSLAGLFIWLQSIRLIFILAGIIYTLGSLLLHICVDSIEKETKATRFTLKDLKEVYENKPFIHLLVFTVFYYVLFAQLFVTLPEYAKNFTTQIQGLFFINSITGLLLQYPAGHLISNHYKPHLYMSFGIFILFLSYFTICLWGTASSLFFAMILFTIGQIFITPIIETCISHFSDQSGKMGLYFGIGKLADGLGRPLGSILGGWLLSYTSPRMTWFVFALMALTLLFLSKRNLFETS